MGVRLDRMLKKHDELQQVWSLFTTDVSTIVDYAFVQGTVASVSQQFNKKAHVFCHRPWQKLMHRWWPRSVNANQICFHNGHC